MSAADAMADSPRAEIRLSVASDLPSRIVHDARAVPAWRAHGTCATQHIHRERVVMGPREERTILPRQGVSGRHASYARSEGSGSTLTPSSRSSPVSPATPTSTRGLP